MGTSLNSAGLRLEDHNNLKYSISLTRVGQELFFKVFSWGYKGTTQNIKNALLALPGYSNTKFRKDFNTSQREKLEKGDLASMDITLIYKLLQMLCGLRDQSDDVWVTPQSDSLEYCLYGIKMMRNEVAHEELMLSSVQMTRKLEELKELFLNTISKASVAFNVASGERNDFANMVSTRLDAIRNSPVPLPTIEEHENELFMNRRTCIIDEGKKEMMRLLDFICQTSVVPCLTQQTVNVSDLYTEPKLRRDETQITQRQLSMSESYVCLHDLFETKECDGFIPDVIVISALNGMGRSTLLKYVTEKLVSSANVMKGIEDFDLILYLECRKVTFSSVDELTSVLLPRTAASFQSKSFTQCFLSVNLILMIDDIDELDSTSFSVFEKFTQLTSPASKIVLTASREKAKYVQRKISALHKRVMLLELEGIAENKILKHLHKILRSIPSHKQDHNEQELYELIKSKYPHLQEHLKSPEVLGLIAFGWSYAPDRINAMTTVAEIFLLVEDLLIHKIYLGLMSSSLPGIHDQGTLNSNLYEFLLTLSSVAFDTLKEGGFSINTENLKKVVQKCSYLDLPKSVVSLFLSYVNEEGANPLTRPCRVSFPRRSTLHYYAAWFVTQEIKEASASTTIKELMSVEDFSDMSLPNYQAMVKYMVGMLAVLIPSQLKSRAKEIVQILKELKVSKASFWLQYIEESKCEPTIMQEILKEMGEVWEVEDYSISLTLKKILKMKRPSALTMTVCKSPGDFPHLQEVFETCRECPKVNISLHLYQHFWSEKTEFSDHYLKMLLGSNSSCQLEHFAGRLSEETIPLLPESVKRLALHLTPDMIGTLNRCLLRLPLLQMLYVNLDILEMHDPASIMSISIPRDSVVLSVDMWRVHEGKVDWACNVAKALSGTYARLVLRHSTLDVSSCSKWLKGLQEREITASWIVVGSIYDVTPEDECQLRQCATRVGCRKFVWLKI